MKADEARGSQRSFENLDIQAKGEGEQQIGEYQRGPAAIAPSILVLRVGAGMNFFGNQVAVALLVEVNLLGGRADFLWLGWLGAKHDLDLVKEK